MKYRKLSAALDGRNDVVKSLFKKSIGSRLDDFQPGELTPSMRAVLSTLLLVLVWTGCAHSKADKSTPPAAPPKIKSTPPQKPTVTALNALAGKVVLVNAGLRFVVVDFSVGRKPAPGQCLGIYRKEQKIGEVKISGQSRDVNFAADLVTGEVRVGDEIRED